MLSFVRANQESIPDDSLYKEQRKCIATPGRCDVHHLAQVDHTLSKAVP